MAKNTLFNFLFRGEDNIQIPSGYLATLDINKEGHHYYRIECPIKARTILSDKNNGYELNNHHISIYENEFRDNPKLSQYHYTAEFTNVRGEIFRLHAYFNAFDELLPNLSFEKKTDNDYEEIDSKDLKKQFISLALKHTEPLIKKLRQQHNEAIKTLENLYNECDQNLAKYFDSKKNDTSEMLALNKEACIILKDLIPLVRSSNYAKALRFHQIAARSLENQFIQTSDIAPSEPAHTKEQVSSKEEVFPEDSTVSEEEVSTQETALTQINSNPSTKPKHLMIRKLENEISSLKSQLEKLTKASTEIQVQNIEQLLALTYEISLTYERQITLDNLHELQKITRGIQKLGANLLPLLLFNNKLELAASLTSFHHLLHAEKFLTVALQTNNSALLDFILKYGDVDVNHQPVTVRQTPYPSLVHACFNEDDTKHPMSECLSVLIQHGANLCVPDKQGLPIAYSILAGESHPLCKAFFMNRDKTINSIDFFKKLIVLLQDYMEEKEMSASEARIIELEIKSFEIQIEQLQNAKLDDPSSRFLMKRINQFEEKYFGTLILRLKKEPEVIEINKEMQKAVHEFNSKTSRAQRRKGKIAATNAIENLDKFLEGMDVSSVDYELIKAEVLKNMNNNLQLVQKKSRLFDVQNEITRHPIYTQRGNKNYRENIREQGILLQEIKELESKNALFQDYSGLNNMQKELENLNQALESLKGMSMLLTQFSNIFSSPANTSETLSTDNSEEEEEIDLEDLTQEVNTLISKSINNMG